MPRNFNPLRVYDVTGDGRLDLICCYGYDPRIRALSVADFSETLDRESLLGLDPAEAVQRCLIPAFPDRTGDGVDEYLMGLRTERKSELLFFSGEDFTIAKRLAVSGRRSEDVSIVAVFDLPAISN